MNHDYRSVKSFVSAIRLRIALRGLFVDFAIILSVFLILSSAINLLFSVLPLVILPIIFDISAIAAFCFTVWRVVDRFIFHPVTLEQTARSIELRSGKQHLLLSIALEFGKETDKTPFILETFRQAAAQISTLSKTKLFPPVSLKPFLICSGLLLIWGCTSLLFKPSPFSYWDTAFRIASHQSVTITPGTVRIHRGSDVSLQLTPKASTFPSSKLTITNSASLQKTSFLLRADSNGIFHYHVRNVTESFSYRFNLGGETFKDDSIIVMVPPVISGLIIEVIPPSYTGAKKYTVPDGRIDISVAAGSNISISAVSKKLANAKFILNNDTLLMKIVNDTASVTFSAKENLTGRFSLEDRYGIKNDSLPEISIGIAPDELPYVQIVKPGYDKAVQPELQETLWVEAVDDFGIKSMNLQWYKSNTEERSVETKKIPVPNINPTFKSEIAWNLTEISLFPGDTLYYWITVRDNYPFDLHEAHSDTFAFRLPGFEEIQQNVMDNESYASEKITESKNAQDKLISHIDNILKSTQGDKELTWQQKQAVDEVKKELDAQADTLQSALESLQESVEKLKKEGVLDDNITSKMDEVRKALEDLIATYGDSLFQVNKEQKDLDANGMREALKQTRDMLPELGQRLDNTLQYLELLKKDHDLAMMALQAEKLASEQSQILQDKNSPQSLEHQKELQQKVASFSSDVKNNKTNNEKARSSIENIDKQNKQMQSKTDNGEMPESQEMSSMSSALMDASQKLKESMSSSRQKQMKELKKALIAIVQQLFFLSDWNKQNTIETASKSDKDRATALQALIESIGKLRDHLDTIKALPPVIKKDIREQFETVYQSSQQSLEMIASTGAYFSNRFIESGLETLEDMILTIIESMNNQGQQNGGSGGSGDLMSQLQGLSGKQSAINSAVSQLLQSMLSGKKGGNDQQSGDNENGMSDDQKKARGDAERAEKELSKQLEQLAKKFGEKEGSTGQEMSKRIEELHKEAEAITEKLQKPPTQEVADRQDKFLSRMLQATLSLHKQGEGDKDERKSESAKQIFSKGNNARSLDNIRKDPDAYFTMRRKAFNNNFPPEYRQAIKTYFDSLGVLFLKEKQ